MTAEHDTIHRSRVVLHAHVGIAVLIGLALVSIPIELSFSILCSQVLLIFAPILLIYTRWQEKHGSLILPYKAFMYVTASTTILWLVWLLVLAFSVWLWIFVVSFGEGLLPQG